MELLIAGVVSIIVQLGKKLMGTSEIGTIAFLLAVSFAGAALITLLQTYGLWESFIQLALTAAGIHGLLLRRLEGNEVR